MPYKVTYTERFRKHLKRLNAKEIEQFKRKVRLFAENPFHPSLRTKKMQGTEVFECSVNMDIRIIWFYESDQLIALLDIGHHDILWKQY